MAHTKKRSTLNSYTGVNNEHQQVLSSALIFTAQRSYASVILEVVILFVGGVVNVSRSLAIITLAANCQRIAGVPALTL